jgi:lysophospholipase L1-like esterase
MHTWSNAISAGVLLATTATAMAQPIGGLGIAGDSLSNEYYEFGWYSARSWPQILLDARGINLGPTAAEAGIDSWDPRRWYGNQYNFARGGATTDALVLENSTWALYDLARARSITHVVIGASGNDLATWNNFTYVAIYEDTWSTARKNAWADSSVANVREAVQGVLASGTKVVLLNMPDFGVMPFYHAQHFPDPAGRLRVTAVVQRINSGLRQVADEFHIPLVDLFSLDQAIFGPVQSPRETILVGGKVVQLQAADPGTQPLTGFVSDNIHFNTIIQAMWANAIITALNGAYHTGIAPLTEEEMLSLVGVASTQEGQLPPQIGPWSQFVVMGPCRADFNASGNLDVQDIFDFVNSWMAGGGQADFDLSGALEVNDIFEFLGAWLGGC